MRHNKNLHGHFVLVMRVSLLFLLVAVAIVNFTFLRSPNSSRDLLAEKRLAPIAVYIEDEEMTNQEYEEILALDCDSLREMIGDYACITFRDEAGDILESVGCEGLYYNGEALCSKK